MRNVLYSGADTTYVFRGGPSLGLGGDSKGGLGDLYPGFPQSVLMKFNINYTILDR